MAYTYPDKNDKMTEDLIRSVSNGNYWGESEKNILTKALDAVRQLPRPRSLLDLGCGQGRLFRWFAPETDSIIALEPDEERCAGAYRSAAALPGHSITVLNTDSSVLVDGQTFDIILSSHVLQHIPPALCREMAGSMKEHTHPGSLIILTTTHTDQPDDILTAETMTGGHRQSRVVSETEFLTLFDQEGVLPVRMFAEDTILGLFRGNGFELLLRRRFHYDGADSITYDEAANAEIYGESAGGPGESRTERALPKAVTYTANARDCFYLFRRME